jgi:hypothetical protein
MELATDSRTSRPRWRTSLWGLVFVALLAWQAWQTLGLFGADQPWQRLLDGQPILSGRHALHLYHGYLGARSFRERGTLSCYDPAFQAGYPKTPLFDSGSRPAELFLTLGGGTYRPEAYKIGLAACYMLVPFLIALAGHGAGLGGGATCLATAASLLVCCGTPGRQLLESGDLDWLLGALLLAALAGLLVRFHHDPGIGCWFGVLFLGIAGWFVKPALMAGFLPLVLVYYLSTGVRHGPAWHGALLAGLIGAVLIHFAWLRDALASWWICTPPQPAGTLLSHRTLHTIWAAPLWGDARDRVLAGALLGAGAVGVLLWNAWRERAAARLFGLGSTGLLVLAVAGIAWEPVSRLGTERLVVPALWFAAVPAAHAMAQACRFVGRWVGRFLLSGLIISSLAVGCGLIAWFGLAPLCCQGVASEPLALGLGPEREELLDSLRSYTTPEARILWEEGIDWPDGPGWTALLPILTERPFMGGLDPDGGIEHSHATLKRGVLAGRPVADWSDAELEEFCRRYNLGWVACWSQAAVARFRRWPGAEFLTALPGESAGCLFQLPFRSFVLKGQARLLHADVEHIALADVVPEEGQVVLSMHYQSGLTASTGRVQIEREPDPQDPIPFIRLRLTGPVARVVLTWKEP